MKNLPAISGAEVFYWEQCTSTNALAAAKLRLSDNSAGAVILAGEQTAGRGRLGRSWTTAAGQDLAMSLAWPVRTPRAAERLATHAALLNMALALDVQAALQNLVPPARTTIKLKWPNDLVAFAHGAHRKLGGMLIEPQWSGPHLRGWVVGLGINVASRHMHRPHQGVSLWEATGQTFPLPALFTTIAERWIHRLTGLENGPDIDGQALLDAYHRELVFLGTPRHYRYAGEMIEATLERVHDDGTADFNITGSGRLRLSSAEIRGLLQEDHKG
jgi:BirA family biotin operon repressor/biotin-[acetyl-CoA-carboxylase] ligase